MKRSSYSQLFEIDDRHVGARERTSVAWRARAKFQTLYVITAQFSTTMVLWCSWLSLLSNTQAVLSSSLSGIIVLLSPDVSFGGEPVLSDGRGECNSGRCGAARRSATWMPEANLGQLLSVNQDVLARRLS
jgi:hypothetical protein